MASLYDSASLVMIPSGYKDDKLYSIKPTNGDGDFTFSRDGSGASPATRVNASGLIEKGRTNELLQSNQFDTTWALAAASITGGQADKDGGTSAWLLQSMAAFGQVNQTYTSSSAVETFSVYAKAGNVNWIRMNLSGAGNCYFDLANGVVGTASSSSILANIESIGSGWYRCSITNATGLSQNAAAIFTATADGVVSALSGDNVVIQSAQRENGLVATDYIETTTAPVSAGLLGDMPRLDYSGGATCPSLLLEPSRVNLVEQSEYYTGGIQAATITTNDTTSPEGVSNASSIVEDSTNDRHRFQTNAISVTSGNSYTFSIFAKVKSGTRLLCVNADFLFNGRAYFDLVNGDVEGTDSGTASIQNFGDGWYRCVLTGTATTTRSSILYVGLEDGTTDSGYLGDGTSGLYLYGMQVESGSYPTSYIPTYGSASTRGGDVAVKTSASAIIGQTEGAIFMEVDMQNLDKAGQIFMELYQDANNRFGIAPYWDSFASQNKMQLYQFFGGALQVNIQEPITSGVLKVAVGYKENDYVLYINGVQIGTDTSASVPSTSTIYLGSNGSNFFLGNGVKQALLFKTRLTNAELAALTA